MSDIAICVENLGKLYRIGERERYLALRDVLARLLRSSGKLLRGATIAHNASSSQLWALRDVSFEIRKGDVVGILGRNGAGKSTLLKILARVTKPTRGFAEVHGRMGSLLEVGTGFHPELTGRENVFLSGAILGMRKVEIRRKFDEIVAFAEVEKFIDTPVKHYSSGMQMRLAFAVAAHLDTEILLIDEVLAVGDTNFQRKCLEKVGDVARAGRTVLFVSHSLAAVATLCRTAILLRNGLVEAQGPAQEIIDHYLTAGTSLVQADLRFVSNRRGSGEVRIVAAVIRNVTGEPCSNFRYGEGITFEFTLEPSGKLPREMICVVWIKTTTGIPVLHLASHDDPSSGPVVVVGKKLLSCTLKHCQLYPGTYVVSFWAGPSHQHDTDLVMDVLQFRVEQGSLLGRGFDMNWTHAVFHSPTSWTIKDLPEELAANINGQPVRLLSR